MPGDISFIQREGASFCDILIEDNDIRRGDTLASAISILLMTDRRVTLEELDDANMDTDIFPADRKGWWGDALREQNIGSKMWLSTSKKRTDKTLREHSEYADEALQPLLDSGVVKKVFVLVEWTDEANGVMDMRILCERPDNTATTVRFNFIWSEIESNGL